MIIPIVPVPKPRMVQSDRWRQRPAVLRYWDFKDRIKEAYPHPLPSVVEIVFHMPIPKSYSKKKREALIGAPHQAKPDIDNLAKSVMDCLAEQDQHVYDIHARKFWAEEGAIELNKE